MVEIQSNAQVEPFQWFKGTVATGRARFAAVYREEFRRHLTARLRLGAPPRKAESVDVENCANSPAKVRRGERLFGRDRTAVSGRRARAHRRTIQKVIDIR
jgi:hypothetical protein